MSNSGTPDPGLPPAGDTTIRDVQDFPIDRIASMRREVAKAVREGRLTIAFQPVAGTGKSPGIAFHEVLLRMVEPDGSLVPAGKFLPLFQEPDLGRILDCTALKRALQALKADLGLRVSVNVGALSFGCEEWLSLLDQAERALPDIGRRLVVEISEVEALADLDRTRAFMDQLAARGVALALDRFAADDIWLPRLKNFRFGLVKFDGRAMFEGEDASALTARAGTLIEAAHGFEITTVAEFVETPDAAQVARGLGIDCLQGFLIGQPELVWKRELETPELAL